MKLRNYLPTRYLILTLLFSLLTGLDTLVVPVFVNSVIASIENHDLTGLVLAALYGIIGYALLKITYFLWQISHNQLMLHFSINIKEEVMSKVFLRNEKVEFIQNILYRDIQVIQKDYIHSLIDIIYCLWFSFVSAVYIFSISWEVSLVFISFSTLPLLIPTLFSKKIEKRSRMASQENQLFLQEINEDLKAVSVIKHYQRICYFKERFLARLIETEKATYHLSWLTNLSHLCIGLVSGVAGLAPFVFGGWLVIEGKITVGGLIAVFLASDRVLSPLQSAFSLWNNVIAAKPIKEKVETFLDTKPATSLSKESSFPIKSIEFTSTGIGRTACFYRLNATVTENEKVLLIGASGSGKSTLFATLFQEVVPIDNTILLNHQDLMTYSQGSLFASIGYIPQDIIIFDDSIAFNITLGEDFTDEEVRAVLKKVQLGKLLQNKGLAYHVGSNGCHLSGGEKARIVIARALIRNYSLLLVDEFASSLDKETATQIRDLLLNLEITLIEIAHHFTEKDRLKYHQVWQIDQQTVTIVKKRRTDEHNISKDD